MDDNDLRIEVTTHLWKKKNKPVSAIAMDVTNILNTRLNDIVGYFGENLKIYIHISAVRPLGKSTEFN